MILEVDAERKEEKHGDASSHEYLMGRKKRERKRKSEKR